MGGTYPPFRGTGELRQTRLPKNIGPNRAMMEWKQTTEIQGRDGLEGERARGSR